MSFIARGHPQQVSRRDRSQQRLPGMDLPDVAYDVDDRATAPEDFAHFDARFHFTIDVAASPHNAKCERFYTVEDDGLSKSWMGERVWCNPPYSNIEPWVIRAGLSLAELVVMLLPANRTEQGWWQKHVEPYRDGRKPNMNGISNPTVEFLPGRMRFIAPGAERVGPNERPPFGCCLLIWS